MAKRDDGLDALRYAFEALGRKSAQDTREELLRKLELAQDYSDFNGGKVEDIYERLEYVRQFAGQRENPMQQAYPELWDFMKSVAEAFRGQEIGDRELASIIAAGIRSWKDDQRMCQCIEFHCGICGKKCAYRFDITEQELYCSAVDHVEMHKRHMFRQMGFKFSEHCPYSLK